MFNSSKAIHTLLLRRTFNLLAAVCLAAGGATFALAAPSDLDASFGTDGKVTINSLGSSEEGRAVLVQPDGKILVAGQQDVGEGPDFILLRYNPDGTPDTSFGDGGMKIARVPDSFDYAYAMALQPDGKIVLGGQAISESNSDFMLVRYNANGSLDTSFDGDGVVKYSTAEGWDMVLAVVVQPDGKIVAAGSTSIGPSGDLLLARYNPNGSLDTSFDTDGKVITSFSENVDEAYALALQADGRIVAVGYTYDESNIDMVLVRYQPNGALDTSFDTDGKLTLDFSGTTDMAHAVAIQPDGKIVIAGHTFQSNTLRFALARLHPNGALDTTFDGDGKVSTTILGQNDVAFALAIQPDGKLVAAGSAYTGTDFDFGLARFHRNGALDTSFDMDGKLTTAFSNKFDSVYGAAVQPDGRIVVAGFMTNNTVRHLALARYVGDATPNQTVNFDADRKTDIAAWNSASGFWHIRQSSDNTTRTPVQFGSGALGDRAVPGDYDGDRKTDIAVWRAGEGTWYILRSSNNSLEVIAWGQSGDRPVQGDYDADGRTDAAVFRPTTGAWYIRNSSAGTLTVKNWGASSDLPVPADYDGDGATDAAVWRAGNGNWYINTSRDGFLRQLAWGKIGDKVVPADYDGDGRVDAAIYRPSEGNWHVLLWSGGIITKRWGSATDEPVAADYDADGKADVAVYRAAETGWHINESATGNARYENLLQPGTPLPSAHLPQQ